MPHIAQVSADQTQSSAFSNESPDPNDSLRCMKAIHQGIFSSYCLALGGRGPSDLQKLDSSGSEAGGHLLEVRAFLNDL